MSITTIDPATGQPLSTYEAHTQEQIADPGERPRFRIG
jgi:hypothetical protein